MYARGGYIERSLLSPHMALSHESMPIITVGAYRMHACRAQSRSTEVRECARQPIAPLARALRRLRRQPGTLLSDSETPATLLYHHGPSTDHPQPRAGRPRLPLRASSAGSS